MAGDRSGERFVLAVDSGGAGIRAVAFARDGAIVAREYCPTPATHPEEGASEHDPLMLWEALLGVVRRLFDRGPVRPESVAALGIANQRASFCLWERASGRPVSSVVGWQDIRAAATTDAMNRDPRWRIVKAGAAIGRALTRDAFLTAASMLSFTTDHASCRLKWLLDRDPGLKARCRSGEILFGTLDSWFIYNLTGRKLHLTDPSNASGTSLYDPFGLRWNALFFKLFDLPLELMPEVRDTDGDFGATDPALFGAAIPIRAAVGDQMAALFGQCCFEAGEVKISQGSGAFVDVNVGPRGKTSPRGLFPLVAWVRGGRPRYMLEGYVATAGTLIDWLGGGLGLADTAAALNEYASGCTDTDGVIFLPTPMGIRFPHFNPRVRGSVLGLSLTTRRAHVARAVFEGIALSILDILDGMAEDVRTPITVIKTDGGVSRSDILLQCLADFANVLVVRSPEADMTASGAAYLAGLSVGFWKSEEELKAFGRGYDTFTPGMDARKRIEKVTRWRRAVKAVLALHREPGGRR